MNMQKKRKPNTCENVYFNEKRFQPEAKIAQLFTACNQQFCDRCCVMVIPAPLVHTTPIHHHRYRPFKMPLFPSTPLIFPFCFGLSPYTLIIRFKSVSLSDKFYSCCRSWFSFYRESVLKRELVRKAWTLHKSIIFCILQWVLAIA